MDRAHGSDLSFKTLYSSLPISSQIGFITRKSGFLTITWALYQTATPPLWASNGLLPSTLMYHEFTWRSCVGWYLQAGVTVPHWLSTGSTKPCLNGFKSAMPSYFSLGICSSWLAPSELAKLWWYVGRVWTKKLDPHLPWDTGKGRSGVRRGCRKSFTIYASLGSSFLGRISTSLGPFWVIFVSICPALINYDRS